MILDPAEREAWLAGTDDPTLGTGARLRHHPVRRFGIQDEGEALLERLEG